jgi:hypothetical protein
MFSFVKRKNSKYQLLIFRHTCRGAAFEKEKIRTPVERPHLPLSKGKASIKVRKLNFLLIFHAATKI